MQMDCSMKRVSLWHSLLMVIMLALCKVSSFFLYPFSPKRHEIIWCIKAYCKSCIIFLIGSVTSRAATLLECKIWNRGFGTTLSEMKGSLWNLSSWVTSRWKAALTAASFENGWRIDYSYQDVTLWWLKVQLAIASSHWRALALGIICCSPLNLKVWSARWTVITHNGSNGY